MKGVQAKANTAELSRIPHWIGGSAVPQDSARDGAEVFDPARGKAIRRVPFADANLVREAVAAAASAFPGWAATSPPRRAQILFRYRDLLVDQREALARLVTEEHGKTLAESRAELDRGIQVVEFAAGIPHLMKGETLPDIATGLGCSNRYEPLGVCLGITPFNFPAMVPMWMFPVAIAAGNSFIIKPSEKDPGCSVRLAELFAEAGLPPGVFNVVHGARDAVEALIAAPEVAAVSFVGSSPVAHAVYRAAADGGKRAQCLGGAKNHMVVMPDADMERAAAALTGAAYGCAGERCMSISVAVAVGEAGVRLMDRLKEQVPRLSVGPGAEQGIEMGPLITAEHRDKVARYLETGVQEGAELVVDGRKHPGGVPETGFFLGPSVFDRVKTDMSIYRDEIFGPVLCVMRVDTLDEAMEIVNGHDYANGGAIFTRSGAAADRFSREAAPGMIGINVPVPAPTAYYGFGGNKQSLFGPLHIHGKDGVRFYTRMKTITSHWPDTGGDDGPSGF